MFVSAVSALRGAAPIKKTAKTAKVSKRIAAQDDHGATKSVKPPVKEARRDRQAAPKPPAAMSSPGVQAALTFLKSGL
jgi:hypothetical protein